MTSVALRKESVDRNLVSCINRAIDIMSLSARRAWIEIIDYIIDYATDAVALRKESVDRNFGTMQIIIIVVGSLSARRAWIEITQCRLKLSKCTRRSPQGERG